MYERDDASEDEKDEQHDNLTPPSPLEHRERDNERHGYSSLHSLHPLQHPFDFVTASLAPAPSPAAATLTLPTAAVPLDTLTLVTALYQLAITSLGPHSRPKLVHLNPNSPFVTLTTACSRLFSSASNLPLTHPLSILLSSSLAPATHSDAGLYTLALTCRLISHAFLDAAPPLPVVLHAHQLALEHILTQLSPSGGLLSYQPLTRLPAVLRFVRSILQSKPTAALSAEDADYLSVLVVQSVLSTLSIGADGSTQPSVIRYYDGVGCGVRESELYGGVILDVDLPPLLQPASSLPLSASSSSPREYGDVSVLLYNTSLTLDPSDHHSELKMETSSTSSSSSSSSSSISSATPLISELISKWQSVGATAVFCQRVMHPMLRFLCHTHNILTVDRLSIRHIHAVQTITAATVQSTLTGTPTPAQLGHCHIQQRNIAGRSRLCLSRPQSQQQPRQRPAATLVLCHRTESVQSEMRLVVEQAVAALQSAIRDDGQLVVVGGGGVVERQLANRLRLWLHERQSRVDRALAASSGRKDVRCGRLQILERGISWSVQQVVEMLEDISRVIGGWDDEQIEQQIEAADGQVEEETGEWRSVNVEGDEVTSWRMREGELQVDDDSVLDSAASKRHALQRAVEIAAVVMRVKQIIETN